MFDQDDGCKNTLDQDFNLKSGNFFLLTSSLQEQRKFQCPLGTKENKNYEKKEAFWGACNEI